MNDTSTLLMFGGAVKALGAGKVGGYLVRFSTDADPDLAGDFFTKSSDFDVEFPSRLPVYYDHGMDPTLGKKRLTRAEVKVDDVGVWAETQLDVAEKYQAAIYGLCEQGKLGYSSGSVAHLVERSAEGKANHIKQWPLAECSLTPTPCEPRNVVTSLKSYAADHEGSDAAVKSFKALLTEITGESADAEAKSGEPRRRNVDDAPPAMTPEAIVDALSDLPLKSFLSAMGAVAELTDQRLAWYADQRATKQGRAISADNLAAMTTIRDGMQGHVDSLTGLLETHGAAKDGDGEGTPPLDTSAPASAQAHVQTPKSRAALNAYTALQLDLYAHGGVISF